jgi:hypothetical protein
MAPGRLADIYDAQELARTGTYKDDYGKEHKISEEDQMAIIQILPYYAASGIGLLPSDVASAFKKVVKATKKKVKSTVMYEETDEKELDPEKEIEKAIEDMEKAMEEMDK